MPKAPFNSAVHALSGPPIPLVQEWAQSYDGAFGPVLDLSQAVPGYSAPDTLLQWLGDAASDPAYTGYGKIEGELELRKTYAAHVEDIYGAPMRFRNIHITSGCNQAFMSVMMAVAGAGDTVLVSNPYYFNHETTLEMLGIKARTFETDAENGFVPDLASLKDAVDDTVRAILLVTPNNPTGALYPPDLLDTIFEFCRDKSIWLIVDETYRDFLPMGIDIPHQIFKQRSWQENFIQLYSFSKSFCIPGHRLGAITAGDDVVAQVSKVMDNMQICAPRPPQVAVTKALPALTEWRKNNRRIISDRSEKMGAVLGDYPDWKIAAKGAYFAYIKHPFSGVSSVDVANKLATERGVICIPGAFFGAGQEAYLRMAFANADIDTIGLLGDRLKGFTA